MRGVISFANQLFDAGVENNAVSALLRDSSVEVIKDSYGRPHLNVLKVAVDNVQRIK